MPEPTPPAAAASEAQNTGYPVSGWVEAGLYVFAIAVLSLAYAVGNVHGAHPIAFILYAMLVSAVVLLAVNGPGPTRCRSSSPGRAGSSAPASS
jgi:hypothetical protein